MTKNERLEIYEVFLHKINIHCNRGVTGCALMGSGDVGMVLDMGYVLNQGKEAID